MNTSTAAAYVGDVTSVVEVMNSSNNTTIYEPPFNEFHTILIGITLSVLLIIGITFNLVTILVIRSTPKLQNVFMQFIISLCISDMLSAVASPLFWYRRTLGFDVWGLPVFLCKMYWGIELMTSYVTSLHIVSFAVLRFISIQFPSTFNTITLKKVALWIISIWLISFLVGFIPLALLFGPEERIRNSENKDAKWPACTVIIEKIGIFITYQNIVYPIFFYAPIALVILLSCSIGIMVRARAGKIPGFSVQSTERRHRKELQAFVQLFLIVLCFLFGYIPFTAYQYWASGDRPNTRANQSADYWFGIAEYLCLRISECLNPVFYNLGSSKMRHYTKRYISNRFPSLVCLWRCGRKSPETPSRSSTSLHKNSNSGAKNLSQADLGV